MRYIYPVICVWARSFLLFYRRPFFCHIRIYLYKAKLILWHLRIGVNRVDGAGFNTEIAIDADLWVNYQKIGPLVKAAHGAGVNTFGIAAFDTGFSYYKSHRVQAGLMVK